jgi:hypothetical protein
LFLNPAVAAEHLQGHQRLISGVEDVVAHRERDVASSGASSSAPCHDLLAVRKAWI